MTSWPPGCADRRADPLLRPDFATTWIEHWPAGVAALSFPAVGFPLSVSQAHALGRRNGVHAHLFETGHDASLDALCRALDGALAAMPDGAFARLGSRSPKDTHLALVTGCRAFAGCEVIRLLTAGSGRVAFDLARSLRHGCRPWVFLRPWQEIEWDAELRCFLHQGHFVGASQYHHAIALTPAQGAVLKTDLAGVIAQFVPRFASAWGGESVAFDVWLANADHEIRLIEVNPWGAPTDACLFSWKREDFDGSVRIRTEAGVETIAVAADRELK